MAETSSDPETTTVDSYSEDASDSMQARNTIAEKRKMRNERKKRKRKNLRRQILPKKSDIVDQRRFLLVQERLEMEKTMRAKAEADVKKYRGMARTYFDRFCWEVKERKELLRRQRLASLNPVQTARTSSPSKTVCLFNEIDVANLQDPVSCGEQEEKYIGRGSFSIVKVQLYRGLKVAVKRYLPRCVKDDVKREAAILCRLCHPFLPLLIGVSTTTESYYLIMQFHGVNGFETTTVWKELETHRLVPVGVEWLVLCGQLAEAIRYIHCDVECLHNDIKIDNVVICESDPHYLPTNSKNDLPCFKYQIVLIDFGQASLVKEKNSLQLTENEKASYKGKFEHLAPEVIEGCTPYSTKSDIYAFGHVLRNIGTNRRFLNLSDKVQARMVSLFERCLDTDYTRRPEAELILKYIENTIEMCD
jgi:hypothetical protein